MRTISVLDLHNYEDNWRHYRRFAVRAVIFHGSELLMVRSRKDGFYKFPGGGIERGESHSDTLIRETEEEVGLTIIPESIRELGRVREIRRSLYGSREVFDQTSYYYFARVSDAVTRQNLDVYEAELGYELASVLPSAAIAVNAAVNTKPKYSFLTREGVVLEWLMRRRRRDLKDKS
jgi:8-oxo-dGTP pyrophosphatase MutT (NUDIX family)